MEVGDRIRQIRHAFPKKITQAEFAEQIGATRGMVNTYERGDVTPPKPILLLICKTYNVNYQWLTEGVGEMFAEPAHAEEKPTQAEKENKSLAKSTLCAVIERLDDEDWAALARIIEKLKGPAPQD